MRHHQGSGEEEEEEEGCKQQGVRPLGQETFPSQEAEKDRKAVGERRGIQRNSLWVCLF